MRHFGKKFLSLMLVFIFVFGCVPDMRKIIHAGEPVKYLDYNYETKSFDEKTCEDYTSVTSSDKKWKDGWYVVDSDVTNDNRIVVNGTVNLILRNNFKLTASKGINLVQGNTLNIYAQTADIDIAGKLESTSTVNNLAGIGGNNDQHGGAITINGGEITATGGARAAGIGGGYHGSGSNITINGGKITATGGSNAAGIGGGYYGLGSDITINGGEITATGGSGGAGIGGGYYGSGSNITINGGEVTATAESDGAGIGGGEYGSGSNITINGGKITATGGYDAAGIGGGDYSSGSNITINDGTVMSAGSDHGAGIGGGEYGSGSDITINGGEVTSIAGNYGAGIGGGYYGSGSDITINGGVITATCGNNPDYSNYGAGIGGGYYGSGSDITINGGVITATCVGKYAVGAGIGGGQYGAGGKITINSGEITAVSQGNSGSNAAGIGGGQSGAGGEVTVNGGTITAIGGEGASGIGHGKGLTNDGILKIESGVLMYGDDDQNPPTTLIATGPQENVAERKRYMSGNGPVSPIIIAQPKQSGEIIYKELANRKITGAVLGNVDKLEAVTYQWYSNKNANNFDGTVIDGATDKDYEIPIEQEVGVYHYYCVIKSTIEDGRSVEVVTEPVTIEIKKAEPSHIIPHFTTKIGKKLGDLNLPEQDNGKYSWVEDINTSVGNIGDNIFHLDFIPNDTKNYNAVNNIEIIVTVTDKIIQALKFNKLIENVTYGDESCGQVVTGAATEVTYSIDNTNVADINTSDGALKIKNIGRAIITATAKETDEYASSETAYVLEVNRKRIKVKADDKSSTAGENLVELTHTNDGLVAGDRFTGNLETDADKNKAGTYKINQGTLTAGDNYEIEFVSGIYTVVAKSEPTPSPQPQPTPSPSNSGGDYGGGGGWSVLTPSTNTETTNNTVTGEKTDANQNTRVITKKTLKDIKLPDELKTQKYMSGYEDKTFKPEKTMTRAEVAQAIYRLINKGESINYEVLSKFSDVDTGKWYSKAIAYLTERNIINGSDGKYNPESSITRAETAQILLNLLKSYDTGEKDYAYGSNSYDFSDIDGWYSETIKQLASNGMINGYDNKTFRPNEKIKRSEFIVMIAKVFGRNVEDTSPVQKFPDVPSDYWAVKYINDAAE